MSGRPETYVGCTTETTMATFLFFAFVSLVLLCAPAAAAPKPGEHGTARLIVGALGTGEAQAAVDLDLEPGWHTYWRQPGDAGVPPTFSFEGSRNLAAGEVLFPAPTRMVEDGATIFGYRDDVVFPLRLRAADSTRPIELDVKLAYAVCERVCVPAEAELHAVIGPGGTTPAAITAAMSRIPAALAAPEGAARVRIVSASGADPSWTLTWRGPGEPPTDLFAEAPEGWYLASHAGNAPGTFTLIASEHPAAARGVDVRLTAKGPDRSVEWSQRLDISPGGG